MQYTANQAVTKKKCRKPPLSAFKLRILEEKFKKKGVYKYTIFGIFE